MPIGIEQGLAKVTEFPYQLAIYQFDGFPSGRVMESNEEFDTQDEAKSRYQELVAQDANALPGNKLLYKIELLVPANDGSYRMIERERGTTSRASSAC